MREGTKVVCIDDKPRQSLYKIELTEGKEYEVEKVTHAGRGLQLKGVQSDNPLHDSYWTDRFREIDEQKFRNKLTAKLAIEHIEEVGIEEYEIETI